MMKCIWEDLPERKNLFTVKNTAMVNLNTGKAIQRYSANTKIAVVQKCTILDKTYYRTYEAAHHNLNYAFEASAFGLPNEKAPSAPSMDNPRSLKSIKRKKSANRTQTPIKKQTASKVPVPPKDGEEKRHRHWFSRLFRRKNG